MFNYVNSLKHIYLKNIYYMKRCFYENSYGIKGNTLSKGIKS